MNKFEQTRRDFLRIAGKGMVGAAALTAMPSIIKPAVAEGVEAPAWPWEWKQIDKQKVLERTYASFYTHGGCCAATVAGIVEELAEVYGYPYNQINPRMFANGGGGYGAQTLCGSLGGACAVLGLFCESKDAGALRNEVYAWYKAHEFPQYQPEFESVYTVSNSILCADSVNTWMKASGFEFGSDQRKARCAALSAETAVKVVELLNIKYGFEAAPVVEEAPAEPALAANEYIGVGKGFEGDVKVKVTMDGDKIAKIDVLEQKESMPQTAMDDIPARVIAAQSVEGIDVVAGSTVSSNALIEAIKDALSQIK
ncbi:MAG: C-GCAxxG-C-C family protein [Clostridia bacterium]|nr:C-GCAxxG-C-C family protein [Clostridia bacterium]